MRQLWRLNGDRPTEANQRELDVPVLLFWVGLFVACLVFWALVILGAIYAVELLT